MKTRNGPEARSNASAGWIRPATRGSMPSRYAAVKVGAMTKADRNSAGLTITAFGGAVWVPMAERKSDSTTTIRVNEVTITRTEGASASTVTSATSWSALGDAAAL